MDFKLEHKYFEPTLYTVVCLLYLLRHILFGDFSIPGRMLYGLFFLWSVYYYVKVVTEMEYPPYLKVLNALVILILIYGIPLWLYGTDNAWKRQTTSSYFLHIFFESILPIYSFYYFGKKQLIDDNWFKGVALFFFISVLFLYEDNKNKVLLSSNREEVTNNAAYLWLSLFPIMVFFKRKPVIQYLGVFIILYYIVLGFKRGAILLGAICFLVFLWQTLRTSKLSNKIMIVVAVGALLVFFIPMIENFILNSDYFAQRMERTMEGDSSNRDVIYAKYWSFYWNQNSFLALLFGNGAFGTLKLLGLMAHNDWLEFLIDMGLVGTLVYLVYWIQAVIMCRDSARVCRFEVFQGILLFLVINFGRTLFSMSIMGMSFFATSVFGYLVAQYDDGLYSDLDDSSDSDLDDSSDSNFEDGLNSVSYE